MVDGRCLVIISVHSETLLQCRAMVYEAQVMLLEGERGSYSTQSQAILVLHCRPTYDYSAQANQGQIRRPKATF